MLIYRVPEQEEDACIFWCKNTIIDKAKLAWRIFEKLHRVNAGYVAVRKNKDGSYQITEELTMVTYTRGVK